MFACKSLSYTHNTAIHIHHIMMIKFHQNFFFFFVVWISQLVTNSLCLVINYNCSTYKMFFFSVVFRKPFVIVRSFVLRFFFLYSSVFLLILDGQDDTRVNLYTSIDAIRCIKYYMQWQLYEQKARVTNNIVKNKKTRETKQQSRIYNIPYN